MLLLVSSLPAPPHCALQSRHLTLKRILCSSLFRFRRTALKVLALGFRKRVSPAETHLTCATANVWTWERVFVWDAEKYCFSLLCFLTSFALDALRCSWSKSVQKVGSIIMLMDLFPQTGSITYTLLFKSYVIFFFFFILTTCLF